MNEVDGISIEKLTIGSIVFTTLGAIVGAWIRARFGSTRVTPQPLGVTIAPEAATKADIAGLSEKLDRLDGRLSREISECARRSECDLRCKATDKCIVDIYEKVNENREHTSVMRGKLSELGAQVKSVDKKLDIIISKGEKVWASR